MATSNAGPGHSINQFIAISPVPSHPLPGARGHTLLPLSLIAQVISYVEDVADIARMTRTCRLMYYMTLPVLYERVTLRSYSELRYVDGRPEGFGSGSPFAMALEGLATGNSAGLVKELGVAGSWSEPKADEYPKGKIPDGTILLSIAFRAAIDKMTHLKSFTWSLDIKPTKSIYLGLAARSSLTSMNLRFPTNRAPRPCVVVPPMPTLRRLRVSDIDPLCYPDDISMLLAHARNIEELRIHWSPRMRKEAELSTDMRTIFGKCLESNFRLPLKHLGLQNFYGTNTGDLVNFFDLNTIQSTDFLETFGGTHSHPTTIWVDETWKNIPAPEFLENLKRSRTSELAPQHAKLLGSFSGMQEIYLLSVESLCRPDSKEPISPGTPAAYAASCYSSPGRSPEQTNAALCKDYLHAISTRHGSTLTRLLLSDQWALNGKQLGQLVSSCPNLEQLGVATAEGAGKSFQLLVPFMTKLRALRILKNDNICKAMIEDPELIYILSDTQSFLKMGNESLQWIGIADRVLKVGKTIQFLDEDGSLEWKREIMNASRQDVDDVEIWKLDVLEL